MINVINDLDEARNEEARNEYGNAHSKSKQSYKLDTRHAFLAINGALTTTDFLVLYKK